MLSSEMALLLADVILSIHILFVIFVIISVPLILIGAWRKWAFVRNRWFRGVHLLGILYVVLNTWQGILCPLTIWENDLRRYAGTESYSESFIAHWLGKILFYDLPSWVFVVTYSCFGAIVLSLLWIAPVKWRKSS